LEKYVITGGTRLHGSVEVGGAKNSILPILAATLLCPETCVIYNVPLLRDVVVMAEVLRYFGAKIKWERNTLVINSGDVHITDIPEETMKKMRASNLVIGPLLSRFRYVKTPFPGGCAIGSRPMDYHIKGLQQLGASVREKHGYIEASTAGLVGGEIYLDFPSVGATENIIMAATLAGGVTVIRNAAREPEVVDLANYLIGMGAKVAGAGTDVIEITGVSRLHGTEHSVIPDRIAAGTFMVAAAITGGDVLIHNVVTHHLEPLMAKLKEAGVYVGKDEKGLRVKGTKMLKAVDLKTMPYPGFPTDIQPQMMALMALAQGTSVVSESIFENRFKHADELRRMGADIKLEGRIAVVKGVPQLTGAVVEATDLRAGAALVLAGCAAEGITVVENIDHIDRGYHKLEQKLVSLGAQIVRVKNFGDRMGTLESMINRVSNYEPEEIKVG